MPYPHIYPDPESRHLRRALAGYAGLPMDYLLAGLGADELIDLVIAPVHHARRCRRHCPPTFGMYRFDAAREPRAPRVGPAPADFSLDVDAGRRGRRRRAAPQAALRRLPQQPGWQPAVRRRPARLLDLPLAVVLDEAYVEFAGLEHSRTGWVADYTNLIVLRTFSKWAGLAGMRLGYGAFPPAIVEHLWKSSSRITCR